MATEWAAYLERWTPVAWMYLAYDPRLRVQRAELRALTFDVVAEAFAVVCETGHPASARKVVVDSARLAASEVKRRQRHEVPLNEVSNLPAGDAANEEDSARRRRIWAWLGPLLDRLPGAQRAAIERHMDNVPDAEIARELGYAVKSIKELRKRGMKELKRLAALVPPPRSRSGPDEGGCLDPERPRDTGSPADKVLTTPPRQSARPLGVRRSRVALAPEAALN